MKLTIIQLLLVLSLSSAAQGFIIKPINPKLVGLEEKNLTSIANKANDSIPSIGSLLIWRKNGLAYERYFHSATKQTAFEVKSVTKSITSALYGILKDKGLVPKSDTSVLSVLKEYESNLSNKNNLWYSDFIKAQDSLRKLLTIKHLLSMQTGFLWDDNNPLIHRAFQTSSNPVQFMMDITFEDVPGTTFKYCTGGCQIVSAIMYKATNHQLRKYADSLLFNPIGMNISKWPTDPNGILAGGSALITTPNDLLKFGLLYLNNGNCNGKQIISKEWIKESTSEIVELNEWDVLPNANGYGYYWWRRKINNHQAFVASGYGGQLICVIPDLEMVIVTTCFVNSENRGRSEIKRLHYFIDEIVNSIH